MVNIKLQILKHRSSMRHYYLLPFGTWSSWANQALISLINEVESQDSMRKQSMLSLWYKIASSKMDLRTVYVENPVPSMTNRTSLPQNNIFFQTSRHWYYRNCSNNL